MTTIHDITIANPAPETKSNHGPPSGSAATMDSKPPKTSEEFHSAARIPP